MSEPGSDERRRVAELLRVNAELAAEVRSLAHGRRDSPRSGAMPSARRLTKLESERDSARVEIEAVSAELKAVKEDRDVLQQHYDEVQQHYDEMAREVARLRSGFLGMFRRAWARLRRA